MLAFKKERKKKIKEKRDIKTTKSWESCEYPSHQMEEMVPGEIYSIEM